MSPREIFQHYVDDRRTRPIDGFRCETFPWLSRYTALHAEADGFVAFTRASVESVERIVDDQIAHFDRLRQRFEWKIYDFDEPPKLQTLLEQRGFSVEVEEAFMVLPVPPQPQRPSAPTLESKIEVRRIVDAAGVADVVSVQEKVWLRPFPWLQRQLTRCLDELPNEIAIYCAYVDGTPIGTGWIDLPAGSAFAELHGGAILPGWRGRGLYSLLFQQRVQDARARGCRYVAVDAAPMSKPILLGKGFVFVCHTRPLRRAG